MSCIHGGRLLLQMCFDFSPLLGIRLFTNSALSPLTLCLREREALCAPVVNELSKSFSITQNKVTP